MLIQVPVFGCGYRRIADQTCSATTLRRRLVVEFWLALASAVIVCGRLLGRAWSCFRWLGRPRRRP
jgi:hypothetical protein